MTNPTDNALQLVILENWLTILLNTYCHHPNGALAKVIHYYVDRILAQEELHKTPRLQCQYLQMKKYWAWLSQ